MKTMTTATSLFGWLFGVKDPIYIECFEALHGRQKNTSKFNQEAKKVVNK